jgi:hypothetical protein
MTGEKIQTKGAAGAGPSAPIFCGAMASAAHYRALAGISVVPRMQIEEAIAQDRIRWRRRWYLYPFGYGLVVEMFWTQIRRIAARNLFWAWEAHARTWLSRWGAEIETITSRGAAAEAVVHTWIDTICRVKAQGHMQSWMPAWSGIKSIVLPPSEINDTSQEIDNLLVTQHGIYVIEVKGWRKIGADGLGEAKTGESLGSPVAQCSKKVEHIKSIVGYGVPVRVLAVLPYAKESDAAFELDSRIVFSADQLGIVLRTAHQQMVKTGAHRLDVAALSQKIMSRLDTRDDAKVRHMLWLSEHHPSPDTLRVKEIVAMDSALRSEMSAPFTFEDRPRRPFGVVLATLVSLLLYVGMTDPLAYERHGIQYPKVERPLASQAVQTRPAAKTPGKKDAHETSTLKQQQSK